MIPESFKQDLLNRVDIVDVVSRYVGLKKGGANFTGLCPFHNEKSPSFTISPAKQFYHCFGCGAHGNAIGFLMSYAGLGYIDAVKDLAASAGMQMPEFRPASPQETARRERETDLYALMERALEFYRAELKKSPRAIEYLKRRGLTGEIAARFRIGYAPDDWQGLRGAFPEYDDKALVECGLVIENEGKRYDRFRDRVMFPILSVRGAVIAFGGRVLGAGEPKYLNSPETPLFEKGREVYGLVQAREAIRASSRALVVEGYMDVVALAQYGVGYAVATLGTATTTVHVSKLLRLADELVFCFDGDAAGRKAAWRALEVSLPLAPDHKPIHFLFLPEGDDPDSYVRAHGKEAFEHLIREAPTLSEFLLGELRAGADLSSPEGRSRLLSAAKPYLRQIAAAVLRLQVVKEVAALAAVSQEEAEQILELRQARPYARPAPAKPQPSRQFALEERLLALVFAKPSLALEVDPDLLESSLEESKALAEIVAALKRTERPEEVSDGMLIELLGESPHRELLARAQATLWMSLKLSPEEALGEFRDTLRKLGTRVSAEEKSLLAKILKKSATAEEERIFQERYMPKGP
ncbi:MAG: DNA primase [Burkholderiales bacterium]